MLIAQGRGERDPKKLDRMYKVIYFLRRGAHDSWLEGEMLLDWNDYYPLDTDWDTELYNHVRRDFQEQADEYKAAGDNLYRLPEELAGIWRPLQRRLLFGWDLN